ncbi:MAG: hypothetical protein VX589_00835 [Myxococcota bacterium]|nr:hypothetical protein [Myxococcota bacterium]
MFKPWTYWLIAGLAFLAAAYGRVYGSGQEAYQNAETLLEQGKTKAAIQQLGLAIRNFTPVFSSAHDGAKRLDAIAEKAEKEGRIELAILALRHLRGAMNATRGLLDPFEGQRPTVNRRLAEVLATKQVRTGEPTRRGRSHAQLVNDHLERLTFDPAPSRSMSLLVLLTFAGWIGGTVVTIRRGLDRDVRIKRRPFLIFGTLTLASFLGWLAALSVA